MATFFIQDIYKITGIGVIPVGQVKSGILRIGMKANIGGELVEIKSIEVHHVVMKEAKEGDIVGLYLKNGNYDTLRNYVRKDVEFF